MFHSNVSLFGNLNNSWDTGCARQFLRIPEEQLNMIKSIPGWSVSRDEISSNCNTNEELSVVAEQQTSGALSSVDNNILDSSKSFVKTTENCKEQLHDTFKKLKPKLDIFPNVDKNLFLKSISLLPLNKREKYLHSNKFKRFSSLTDIRKTAGLNMVEMEDEMQVLDKTYVVPAVLDDRTNNTESNFKRCKSFDDNVSIPDKVHVTGAIKKLDDNILKHKYLNEPSVSAASSLKNDPHVSSCVDQHGLLEKKLLLLEKRISPCEDALSGATPSETPSTKIPDSNKESECLETSSLSTLQRKSKLPSPIHTPDKSNISSKFTSVSQSNSFQTSAKEVVPIETLFLKDGRQTDQDDSFASQPVPCAQPRPVETHPVLQTEQSLNKEEDYHETQKIGSPAENNRCKTDAALSAQCSKSDEIQEAGVRKDRGAKRKRKSTSRSAKTSKLQNTKAFNINFTGDQITSMIEIMKWFQSKV